MRANTGPRTGSPGDGPLLGDERRQVVADAKMWRFCESSAFVLTP
jgi:hypothetical protein